MAALVTVSIQDLKPGPQDKSDFYLENIYLLLADPNVSRASILAAPAKPPPFSPPKYAIWVNTLWFLSLATSLMCGLLATMLQQWVRRYLTVTQHPRHNPHKRARIHAFLLDGVDRLHLPEAVELLPHLLHLSLLLFLLGLLLYLFNIHHTVFTFVASLVGLSVGTYVGITLMPIFCPDSPYYAPLSSLFLIVYKGVSYGVFRILRLIIHSRYFSPETRRRFDLLLKNYRKRLWWGVVRTAQETASASASKAGIDRRVLKHTFNALDEDHELEKFFDCIPGFCSSNVVDDPKGILAKMDSGDRGLTAALIRFWDDTLASSFVSEKVKKQRLMTCVKAADSARLSDAATTILQKVIEGDMDAVLRSVEIVHSLIRISLGNTNDKGLVLRKQAIFAEVIAREPVGERGYYWTALVMNQLGVSKSLLREYLTHGNSVLLANLIHFTRQFFHSRSSGDSAIIHALRNSLPSISELDLKNTLPQLQRDFCALWNEIVLEAQITGDHSTAVYILKEIRHIYIALHQGTASAPPTAFSASTRYNPILFKASSYPSCTIPSHGAVVASQREITHPSAATSPTVPLPDPVPATISPPAGPDVSPLPTLIPRHRRIPFADERSPPQDTTTIESSHVTPPVNLENNQFPAILLESVSTATNQGPADTPAILPTASSGFDPRSIPATSTSIAQPLVTLPSTSTVTAEQHNADLGVVPHTIIPVMPIAPFSIPIPGDVVPANPQAASASPSQANKLTPGPGFPPQSSVSAISFTTPQVTSVSHPNIASSDGAIDTHDNSRTPDFSSNMEVPHDPHQPGMSVPGIVTELSRHPIDTVPSSWDTERPE